MKSKNFPNTTILFRGKNSEILIGSDLECMNARHNKLSQIIIASFRILYRVKTHMGLFEFIDIPNILPNNGLCKHGLIMHLIHILEKWAKTLGLAGSILIVLPSASQNESSMQ